MCQKTQFKYCPSAIDPCMKQVIKTLSIIFEHNGFKILACCCGHDRYPGTIIYRINNVQKNFELYSGRLIPRKRNFYKRDKQGYYYIPEVCSEFKK